MRTAGRRVLALLERAAAGEHIVEVSNTDLMLRSGSSRRSIEYGIAQARAAAVIRISYSPVDGRRMIELL